MTFPLAQQSLTGLSQAAAELWDLLTHSQTVEEEAELLAAIWETQEAQEDAIDLHAELAFQLDAEIAGVKQRLETPESSPSGSPRSLGTMATSTRSKHSRPEPSRGAAR